VDYKVLNKTSKKSLKIDFGDKFILENQGHRMKLLYTQDEDGTISLGQFHAVRDRWSRLSEVDRMRGYVLEAIECSNITINDTRSTFTSSDSSGEGEILFDGRRVVADAAQGGGLNLTLS
jgi:hypothetical protein